MLPDPGQEKWATWRLRPIVLFAAAYTIVGVLHEGAHAVTAYTLKVPSTLFHLYANIDRSVGTLIDRAIIRAAGPLFCLVLGLMCWLVYRKAKDSRAGLPLLYLTWFGIGTFFGNLMSTPSVGDFSGLAQTFQLPMPARYAVALLGLLSVCGLAFFVGRELRRFAPAGVGRARATVGLVVVPGIAGTAIAILIFLPMPPGWVVARIGESLFWIFGAVGSFASKKQPAEDSQNLGVVWTDFATLAVTILVVRVLAGGIPLTP